MSDPRQTIERIRMVLRSEGVVEGAETAALAVEYAELCREANQRLQRCGEFLRLGLRGEAAAMAEMHPPLLQWVGDLRFNELPDWERACGALNLAHPPPVSFEAAGELAEAVKKNEPLRELLAKHRRLALSHAPLADRLATLWELSQADQDNPLWKQDAGELELARLAEMRNQAVEATGGGDVARIDALLAEAQKGSWQTLAAGELRDHLARSSLALHQATAAEELWALTPRIRQAYAALSYEQCRQVFAEWGRIVTRSRLTVPPELRREILPLAHWLDEQDDRRERQRAFAAACEDLAWVIKHAAPVEQLQQLYQATSGSEQELPTELFAAYRRALDAARREQCSEKRRQLAFAALLIGIIVSSLAALVWVIMYSGKH